jgi:hypothetical protein
MKLDILLQSSTNKAGPRGACNTIADPKHGPLSERKRMPSGVYPRTPSSAVDRFWSKVDQSGGPDACWIWTGWRSSKGYGRSRSVGRWLFAHRVSWELANGPIPSGLLVCHHCDNPPCVNPAHLFVGTNSDNMRDCISKGRNGACTHPERVARGSRHSSVTHPELVQRGSSHCRAKLTEADIPVIRSRVKRGESRRAVSKDYGVSAVVIGEIVKGKLWKHVGESQ